MVLVTLGIQELLEIRVILAEVVGVEVVGVVGRHQIKLHQAEMVV